MKKILTTLLSLTMAASLAGCASSSTAAATAAAAIGRHNALVPSWTDETAVVAESRAGDTFLYGNLRNKDFTPGGI